MKDIKINSRTVRLEKLGQTFVARMLMSLVQKIDKMNCAFRWTTFCKTRLGLHTMEEDSSKSKMEQTEKCSTKFFQTDNASSDAKTGDVKLVPKQNKTKN